jgi:hypothetical protein
LTGIIIGKALLVIEFSFSGITKQSLGKITQDVLFVAEQGDILNMVMNAMTAKVMGNILAIGNQKQVVFLNV